MFVCVLFMFLRVFCVEFVCFFKCANSHTHFGEQNSPCFLRRTFVIVKFLRLFVRIICILHMYVWMSVCRKNYLVNYVCQPYWFKLNAYTFERLYNSDFNRKLIFIRRINKYHRYIIHTYIQTKNILTFVHILS